MTDAVKPLRQNVEEEAPDELVGGEGYCAISRLPVAAVILVAKGHVALVESHETAVREGDAMSVGGEIGEHRLGPGEGRLGVEEPVLPAQRGEMRGESLAATQARDLAEKRQPACGVSVGERGQEEPPEQAGKHPHRKEEAGLAAYQARAVERYPAAWHDHMDVRVVGHCGAPAVEHGGGADASAEMPGIGGDRQQCLGGRAEQQVVDDRLVLVSDRSDLGRQREDDVEIADRQQIGLAGCEPIRRCRTLTLWAMSVTARVVSDAAVAAILAALDMPAERGRATLLDRRHDLELTQAHMPGIGLPPGSSLAMKDVCDLQLRAAHGRPATPRAAASPRSS